MAAKVERFLMREFGGKQRQRIRGSGTPRRARQPTGPFLRFHFCGHAALSTSRFHSCVLHQVAHEKSIHDNTTSMSNEMLHVIRK